MTASWGVLARLGALALAAVVLQVSTLADVRLLGGGVDLVPLLVGAVALYAGGVWGASTGFSAGLLLDLALGRVLGLSSLVLTAVGYAIGRYRDLRDPGHALIPIPVGAAATAGYGAGLALVNLLLEIDATVSALVIRDLVVTVLLNAVLALLVFAIVRRVLRPVLLSDALNRRTARRVRRSDRIGVRSAGA